MGIRKVVINLKEREDRLFNFRNKNFKSIGRNFIRAEALNGKMYHYSDLISNSINTDRDWLDPFKNRKLSKGEFGCFMSHYEVMKDVYQSQEITMVFEDDAEINHELFDEEYYEKVFRDNPKLDFLYLQHNENVPEKSIEIDDKLVKPYYPYNMTAYIITPWGAEKFIKAGPVLRIKPIDEFLPEFIQNGVINAYALKEDHVKQASRDRLASDIEVEEGNGADIIADFNAHVCTIGTDERRMKKLYDSANQHNIVVKNLGKGVDWNDPMTGRGGGKKLKLIKNYINTIDEYDVVLFTDSYDVIYADDIESIFDKYLGFNTRVLFSAESVCWPNAAWADRFPETDHAYRYLNSGTFIGRVKELRAILEDYDEELHDDDQEYIQEQFLSGKFDIKLDTEAYLFQCHEPKIQIADNGQLYNPVTNCCPSIYHGNGGEYAAETLQNVYETQVPQTPMLYLPVYDKIDHIEKDMMIVNFMNASQCERLIDAADSCGEWAPLPEDKFPAYEIRMKKLGLWDELVTHWEQHIYPLVEKYWHPMEMYGMRDAFVMRYSAETQKSLPLHNDASLVTGSVKLNDNYLGADLVFPRQSISNADVPVGRMILFPGMVTHGHQCTELEKGVKYSLTMWSSRYPGDIIN